jgi:hypothetical protein
VIVGYRLVRAAPSRRTARAVRAWWELAAALER